MKKLAIILCMLIPSLLFAQSNIRESVFSHLSSTELLVGETLHFKNYIYSVQTGKLSKLSRILYVEILNASGSLVYQTKLTVNEGQCFSSFFIPTDLETGNYHFVAYTLWMKNFNKFFREPLVIINPYLNQDFLTQPEFKLNVQITVEGEKLLANAKNKVVLRVSDQFQRGFGTKGKIVSSKENDPIEVMTDEFGFFSFYISPEADETFQLILEKDQGFEFIDLPKPCTGCTQFRVIQTQDLFVVRSRTADPEELKQIQVDFFKNQENVFSSPMVLNTAFSIHKDNLPDGLLRVVLSDENGKVRERLIWNGDVAPRQIQSMGNYETNTEMDIVFPDLQAGNLSVSVEQADSNREALGILWYDALSSKVDQHLPRSFYQQASEDQFDNALLTSKFKGGRENPEEVKYLPEYRSGLVPGIVIDDNEKPITGATVTLAFSGMTGQLSATITDSLGRFLLEYDPEVSHGEPMIDVLSEEPNTQISIDQGFYTFYPEFITPPVVFDSTKVAAIIKRSINNQIMNAYYVQDEEPERETYIPQFDQVKTYKLDDYTRFTTMRDTFIELIIEVGVSKNEDKYDFKMRSETIFNGSYEIHPTLILLDGAIVSSEDLMNLSPYLVDRIDVINHKYYFGKSIFDGVLSVHTIAKDRGEVEPKGTKIDLVPVQRERESQRSGVTKELEAKTPAYQDLLYWNPMMDHEGGLLKLKFRTSEVQGQFEIRVEGISKDGKAISQQAYFTVD
ncbi:carboxypeptidase-like regulatory domain-containing protein [Reichenbachiella sp.]|uniref:carboxypeptidase-like regulatory domain-containing protein n=1 Tax=Reichenbachiella sp. TaxID=2184521 RepID=UPI003BB09509